MHCEAYVHSRGLDNGGLKRRAASDGILRQSASLSGSDVHIHDIVGKAEKMISGMRPARDLGPHVSTGCIVSESREISLSEQHHRLTGQSDDTRTT